MLTTFIVLAAAVLLPVRPVARFFGWVALGLGLWAAANGHPADAFLALGAGGLAFLGVWLRGEWLALRRRLA